MPVRLLPLVAVLALTVGVQSSRAADPEMNVTFNANHTISLTLPDGTFVGTTSGPGTVIPAGSYTLHFDDSVGAEGPEFDLRGPGVMLLEDLYFGESPTATHRVALQPSSTYTWRNNERPDVVFVFNTSATAAGGSSGSSSGGGSTGSSSTGKTTATPSKDVVGSEIVAFRGTLAGDVSITGKLTLTYKGKKVSSLKTGRYKITVLDETSKGSFKLQRYGKQPTTLSGLSFVGKKTVTLTLKPGQWIFYSATGKKSYFIVVA